MVYPEHFCRPAFFLKRKTFLVIHLHMCSSRQYHPITLINQKCGCVTFAEQLQRLQRDNDGIILNSKSQRNSRISGKELQCQLSKCPEYSQGAFLCLWLWHLYKNVVFSWKFWLLSVNVRSCRPLTKTELSVSRIKVIKILVTSKLFNCGNYITLWKMTQPAFIETHTYILFKLCIIVAVPFNNRGWIFE